MDTLKKNLIEELRKTGMADLYVDLYSSFYDLQDTEKRDAWAREVIAALKDASTMMSAEDLKSFMTLNTLRLAAVMTQDAEFHESLLPKYQALANRLNWT